MKTYRWQHLAGFVTLLAVLALLFAASNDGAVAGDAADGKPRAQLQANGVTFIPLMESPTEEVAAFADVEPLGPPDGGVVSLFGTADDCRQLLENPALDLVGNTIPGWVIFQQKVYYSTQNYVSPETSLVMPDADEGDESPEQDAFGQFFDMPADLSRVTIEFYTATANANSTDKAYGNLWTVDSDGQLEEGILSWSIEDSPGAWRESSLTTEDATALAAMSGRRIAIVLFTDTDGQAPGEVVYLDDIRLTACTGTAAATNTPTQTPVNTPTHTPQPTATLTPTPQGIQLNLPIVMKPAAGPPTATPTATPQPSPTPTGEPSTGDKLYLRYDSDTRRPYFSREPMPPGWSTQLYYYSGTTYTWEMPLIGDIEGSRYTFNLYLASSRSTTFGAQLLANGEELATYYFEAGSTTYRRFTAELDGIDPTTSSGDLLRLRVWHQQGSQGGLLMGPPPNADSYIIIPAQR